MKNNNTIEILLNDIPVTSHNKDKNFVMAKLYNDGKHQNKTMLKNVAFEVLEDAIKNKELNPATKILVKEKDKTVRDAYVFENLKGFEFDTVKVVAPKDGINVADELFLDKLSKSKIKVTNYGVKKGTKKFANKVVNLLAIGALVVIGGKFLIHEMEQDAIRRTYLDLKDSPNFEAAQVYQSTHDLDDSQLVNEARAKFLINDTSLNIDEMYALMEDYKADMPKSK